MNNAIAMNAATDLKGSKCWGEFHAADKRPGLFLYKLATGKFAVVEKAEYSGNILSVSEPIEGRLIERHDTLDLGYRIISMYRMKGGA